MKQFYLDPGTGMSTDTLSTILSEFQTFQKPILKQRYDYYLGLQKILAKQASDTGKPCNRICCNFIRSVVDTFAGYCLGKPVKYSSEDPGFDRLMEVFNYNDRQEEEAELFRLGLAYGRAAEICYIDEDGKERFKPLDPQTIIPVYSNDLNEDLLYVIRFWQVQLADEQTEKYFVEVYDDANVTTYKSWGGFMTFEFLDKRPHFFKQVPITIFSLNAEEEGIADQAFSLQDAYNSLYSDSIDDWDSFCDAYMVLINCQADDDQLAEMKAHRVLELGEGADAKYLTKSVSTTEIQNLLDRTEEKIRELTACPNFASESFGTSSGVAIKFRCIAMENKASSILNNFRKALQRRVELLSEIVTLLEGEQSWRDISIEFTRDLPLNDQELYNGINSLRGLISDETLLGQIPFVKNPQEELERLRLQKEESISVYSNLEEDKDELLN